MARLKHDFSCFFMFFGLKIARDSLPKIPRPGQKNSYGRGAKSPFKPFWLTKIIDYDSWSKMHQKYAQKNIAKNIQK